METDEQTPKKQHKKVLHSHKKQYLIYNIIKTKEMLSKSDICIVFAYLNSKGIDGIWFPVWSTQNLFIQSL